MWCLAHQVQTWEHETWGSHIVWPKMCQRCLHLHTRAPMCKTTCCSLSCVIRHVHACGFNHCIKYKYSSMPCLLHWCVCCYDVYMLHVWLISFSVIMCKQIAYFLLLTLLLIELQSCVWMAACIAYDVVMIMINHENTYSYILMMVCTSTWAYFYNNIENKEFTLKW